MPEPSGCQAGSTSSVEHSYQNFEIQVSPMLRRALYDPLATIQSPSLATKLNWTEPSKEQSQGWLILTKKALGFNVPSADRQPTESSSFWPLSSGTIVYEPQLLLIAESEELNGPTQSSILLLGSFGSPDAAMKLGSVYSCLHFNSQLLNYRL